VLRLGGRSFAPEEYAVMAIVNRTPDSFFDRGATFAPDAVEAAAQIGAGAAELVVGAIGRAPSLIGTAHLDSAVTT